ncbi:MAG TPA: glycosyltransferase family 4 protein [Mucilaginibacter sp.]|jgi:glycosyltransferase involved in cell wall biosynthesis
MRQLAIITTHPIQYYAPVFKLLHQRQQIEIKVFYSWGKDAVKKYDPGFKKEIEWDIPLLDGYPFEWVTNTSPQPGSHHFNGIANPDLNRQLKEFNPDAILVFGWAYKSHLEVIRYFKYKIPVYFRGDSTLLDERKNIKTLLRNIYLKWVYWHISHAFYVGANNKAYFKKYGLKESQLSFAPHAIDNERFGVNRDGEAAALRHSLGLASTDILIMFAGKFEEKKNPLLLLDAFRQLDQANCHLLFVGNGELEEELKQKARGTNNIYFKNAQNQAYMPVIYQACDLFCIPSKGPGETWGLAVNEAMAAGKAVLVSDKVGCAADLVKDDHNGAKFISGNAGDLLKKLKSLVGSKEKLTRYGKHALDHIKDWNFINIAMAIESKLLHEKKRQD